MRVRVIPLVIVSMVLVARPRAQTTPTLAETMRFIVSKMNQYGNIDEDVIREFTSDGCTLSLDKRPRRPKRELSCPGVDDLGSYYSLSFPVGEVDPAGVKALTSGIELRTVEGRRAFTQKVTYVYCGCDDRCDSHSRQEKVTETTMNLTTLGTEEQEIAERVAKALRHAAVLCGAKSPAEPF
jgi:hypothetical protein